MAWKFPRSRRNGRVGGATVAPLARRLSLFPPFLSCYLLLTFLSFTSLVVLSRDLNKLSFLAERQQNDAPRTVQELAPTNNAAVYMVTIADAEFRQRYEKFFGAMSDYAARYGYLWRVLGADPECRKQFRYYFFRKHCIVARWMEREATTGDIFFVFDADVVPYRTHLSLDSWLGILNAASGGADLVFYDRTMNNEVAAGNYAVRNTNATRNNLMQWARYEYQQPPGFSSYDNGAIHLHLLRFLGMESLDDHGGCGGKFRNLTASVSNLVPYYDFVTCTRKHVRAGLYNATSPSIQILGKDFAWVMDGYFDDYPKIGRDREGKDFPVFHHGIKLKDSPALDEKEYKKYNISHNASNLLFVRSKGYVN
uniref:Nucleotide-diphospho-sugar transferase domain-containing protein n=1 Tax=Odontella aurita TaxID=265563 RepID=A0A7S4K9T4_9STRA|mmetsp:Transcript_7695/g.22612  ORF Transcript_7695/g.22612 Transcript_7695/m.22612 type:complete len:367 (+) Transcript_7695:42-1142(+)